MTVITVNNYNSNSLKIIINVTFDIYNNMSKCVVTADKIPVTINFIILSIKMHVHSYGIVTMRIYFKFDIYICQNISYAW